MPPRGSCDGSVNQGLEAARAEIVTPGILDEFTCARVSAADRTDQDFVAALAVSCFHRALLSDYEKSIGAETGGK